MARNDSSRISFGLGINSPFGSGIKWPDDWKGKNVIQQIQLNTLYIQPTMSYRLNEKLSLGVGFVYALGSVLIRRGLPLDGDKQTVASAKLSGGGQGLGYHVGIFARPNEKFSIGLSYKSNVTLSVKDGEAVFQVPISLQESFPNTRFSSTIHLPDIWSVGIGFTPTPSFTLAMDLNYTGWSSFDTLAFDYADNTRTLQDSKSARNFKNTFTYRIGGEYTLSEYFKLRGGAFYDVSPVPDGFVSPEMPDANRIGLSSGLSARISQQVSTDLAFMYEFTGERAAIYDEAVFAGIYKTNAFVFGLSLNYRL